MKKRKKRAGKMIAAALCALMTFTVVWPSSRVSAEEISLSYVSEKNSAGSSVYRTSGSAASDLSEYSTSGISNKTSESAANIFDSGSGRKAGGFIQVKSEKKVSDPNPVPEDEFTGNPREDMLTVARSQLGYTETRSSGRQLTYFGTWVKESQGSTGAPWCSEFASWCVYRAGVPLDLYPKCASVYDALEYQGSIGRVFAVEGGNKHSKEWIGEYYTGTISFADIQPGDIVLVNRKHPKASDPTHTATVEEVDEDEGVIHTIDGNVGSKPHKVRRRQYTAKYIYAVVKPLYELSLLENIRAEYPPSQEGRSVRIAWEARKGVNGYMVYRSASADGEYSMVAEINDSAQNYFTDTDIKPGKNYYYKVVPFVETASGAVIDGMSYIEQAEQDDDSSDKVYVKAMTPVVTGESAEPVQEN